MIALDLFAGTGWGVACRRLGVDEYGVEIMPEAIATRKANGMRTIYTDVWSGLAEPSVLTSQIPDFDLLIASPPCQTFSMAGGGAGRKALDDVLEAIREHAYLDPAKLRAFGEKHDPRTALVLTPLAHVARDVPMHVVFEQVPPVLPVWQACAEEMRRWGYSVWTGIVNSEQYGVPQTRRRAILIARADGVEAGPPTATHSRYYSRTPAKLDDGVLPWVSMAEALGWGMTERPMVTAGNAIGRAEGVGGSGAKAAIEREKERGAWRMAGAGATAQETGGQRPREDAEPAHTITGKGTAAWLERGAFVSNNNTSTTGERYERDAAHPAPTIVGGSRSARIRRGEAEQVRTGMGRGMIERHGERPGRDVMDPAFTVLGGDGGNSQPGFGVRGLTDRPSPTITGGGTETGGAEPIAKIDRYRNGENWRGSTERVTVAEAAVLQSYPADFVWDVTLPDGKPVTKTKQFLQIGNAVPPLMAEAIIRAAIERPEK